MGSDRIRGIMKYWKRVKPDGSIQTVESYSHDLDINGAIEITEEEFEAYLASLPVSKPLPVRDLAAEIDDLKARVEKLEKK